MTAADGAPPAAPRSTGIERIRTLSWSGAENASRQVLALLFFFGMVRFLQPSDVGIFSLAVALEAVFEILIDDAIGESLVQKADVSRRDWDTGFTINLGIAAFFVAFSLATSGLMARLFHEPALVLAVPAISCCSLTGALGNIHRAHLGRDLRFRTIAQTALAAQIVGGTFGLGLAVAGCGYWAQIGAVFATVLTSTIIFWCVTPWRPRLLIERSTVRSRLRYAASSAAVRSIYLLRDQGPLMIVGLLAGAANLGFLGLALRVGRSVGQLFEDLTSRPMLSLLSREQHAIAAFGAVLLDILTIVGLLALPAFVGLSEVGQRLIPLVFGAVWAPAGAMLPWVCAVLGGWLVLHIVIVALRARGMAHVAVFVTAPAVALDLLVLVLLARISLPWALMGWAARALLSLPFAVALLRRFLGVAPLPLARRWLVPLLGSVAMLLWVRWLAGTELGGRGVGGFILLIASGAALYGAIVLAGMPVLLRRVLGMVRRTR